MIKTPLLPGRELARARQPKLGRTLFERMSDIARGGSHTFTNVGPEITSKIERKEP